MKLGKHIENSHTLNQQINIILIDYIRAQKTQEQEEQNLLMQTPH